MGLLQAQAAIRPPRGQVLAVVVGRQVRQEVEPGLIDWQVQPLAGIWELNLVGWLDGVEV
jgi:hypothetical protein